MSTKLLYTCKKCGKEFKKQNMSKNLKYCCTCAEIDNKLLNIRVLYKEKRSIDNDISILRHEITQLQIGAESTS